MQATLSHYRVLEQIGASGMGVVFRAHDDHLDRDVALKVLPPGTVVETATRNRFHKEALTLSKLNHPNIATVHDFDTQDGTRWLTFTDKSVFIEEYLELPKGEEVAAHVKDSTHDVGTDCVICVSAARPAKAAKRTAIPMALHGPVIVVP